LRNGLSAFASTRNFIGSKYGHATEV
jgi:hypothetical protein